MPVYEFTQTAEADLNDIVDFTLEQWGIQKTHQYIAGLEEMGQTLADNPDIGLNRDNLLDGLCSFPYESHVLYYFRQSHGISIIRVLHKTMEPERHIESNMKK